MALTDEIMLDMPIRVLLFVTICCACLAGCKNGPGTSKNDSSTRPSERQTTMVLNLSSGKNITNPDDDQVRELLRRLNVHRDGDGFAILGPREGESYIQVSGDKDIGFDMEYQEGDVNKHYRAKREDFTLDDVVRALIDYRDGGIDWSKYGDWERITW